MTWGKVDDKLWGHPKWLAASGPARGLWITRRNAVDHELRRVMTEARG